MDSTTYLDSAKEIINNLEEGAKNIIKKKVQIYKGVKMCEREIKINGHLNVKVGSETYSKMK